MTTPIEITVETSEDAAWLYAKNCRWASVKIGGVTVFSDLVYDVDKDGNRTEAQARQNIINLWAERQRRLLEDR